MNVLFYALELGLPVFPCLENKIPACKFGFKAAAREPDAIRALWRRWPGPLIGVPTGAVSGVDVLDIDSKNGGRAWYEANRDKLPQTRIHRTRSGGLHLLFKHGDGIRNSASKIAPGVDVRGDGGYVAWWPATGLEVRDSSLAEWPAWLSSELLPPPAVSRATSTPSAQIIPFPAPHQILRAVEGILRKVALASPGERNALLFWGACRLRELAAERKISLSTANELLTEAALRTGLHELEIARTIASAQKEARHG